MDDDEFDSYERHNRWVKVALPMRRVFTLTVYGLLLLPLWEMRPMGWWWVRAGILSVWMCVGIFCFWLIIDLLPLIVMVVGDWLTKAADLPYRFSRRGRE